MTATKEVRVYGVPTQVLDAVDGLCEQIGMSRNEFVVQLLHEIAGFRAPHIAIVPSHEGELVIQGRAGNDWGLSVLRVRYTKGWGYLSEEDKESISLARNMVMSGETLAVVRGFLEGKGYSVREVKGD